MALYIGLGPWEVEVRCDSDSVRERLRSQFCERASDAPTGKRHRLTCVLRDDPRTHRRLLARNAFDGPRVDVSPGVRLRYSLGERHTWIKVEKTAILEFDESSPATCRVWLAPRPPSDPNRPRVLLEAEPEAFFYPMLAEWLRRFGACLVHCGAVAVAGRAVMLTGPPGSGKSTHVLRLLGMGCRFLADDLAILRHEGGSVQLLPFREVANVHDASLARFPELGRLGSAPRRGDGKHCVDIGRYFDQKAVSAARPGAVLHLHKDQRPWIEPLGVAEALRSLRSMAWFVSSPEGNKKHFDLLTDLLFASIHFAVSQGYLSHRRQELLASLRDRLSMPLAAAGAS